MLKRGMGFLVVLMLLSMSTPSILQAQAQAPVSELVYVNEVLGVHLIRADNLALIEDEVLVNDEYGFALYDQLRGERGLVLRVGILFDATPDLDQAVAKLMARFPTITFPTPTKITIDGIEAIAVNGVPGIDPNVYIYLVADSHLYQIIYVSETLDDQGEFLLRQLRFVKPVKALDSLGLKRAEDTLYEPSPYAAASLQKGIETEIPHESTENSRGSGPRAVSGCTDWPTAQLIQTPISNTANGTGYSSAGPSYYNQGAHKYCNRTTGLNDYYALDFPLRTGDVVYAPFSGTVKWVGWTCGGWSTLGKVVIVEKYVGTTRYWSMAAHLNSINVQPNDPVTVSAVIGYAGRSGNNSLTYWSSPHLHQGIYAAAILDSSCGGIYAGQSVQPLHVKYYRSPGGYYETLTEYQQVSW